MPVISTSCQLVVRGGTVTLWLYRQQSCGGFDKILRLGLNRPGCIG